MAPIRRYLRITLHSVLEVRIYLDNPALADSWLLRSKDPVLPRVIEAVRPYVVPKLREENEKAKSKGPKKKKRAIKDTVQQDDFEVSIFLTETSTSHTLLTKQKSFTNKSRIKSTSSKLGVESAGATSMQKDPPILVEEDSEEGQLPDLPEKESEVDNEPIEIDDDDDEEDQDTRDIDARPVGGSRKRKLESETTPMDEPQEDDKKKLGIKTTYEGFTIYGRILCLIVKRKGGVKRASASESGSAMLESWVSTQAQQDAIDVGDD